MGSQVKLKGLTECVQLFTINPHVILVFQLLLVLKWKIEIFTLNYEEFTMQYCIKCYSPNFF